jgi:aldose 1-epimerase
MLVERNNKHRKSKLRTEHPATKIEHRKLNIEIMKITKEPFGQFTEYVLTNPETGEALYILPEYGGIIRKMTLHKDGHLHHVIDVASSTEQLLETMKAYPSAHLFPWGNRVRNGKYCFQGTDYQLSINEVGLNNAIHGFVSFANFEVVEEEINEVEAILTLRYTYKGTTFGFPFPFILEIQHIFSSDEGLEINYTIKNTGEKAMPMVLGWHPYFKIEGETADDWQIEFPATHQFKSDNQMISADKVEVDFKGVMDLKGRTLDAVFAVEPSSKVEAKLHSPHKNITLNVWQEGLKGGFTFMVVYIPSSRDCIAIEPMTGNTDAFNSEDGLLVLEAGKTFEIGCGVYIS